MKNSLKTKISHLFKSKSNKLEKYPTYDQSSKVEESIVNAKNNLGEEKTHKNKKSHKKAKTNLKLLDTTNIKEFPVLPSPIKDPNESSKLTAQEFAKAVGIKILHRTDEEEDEDCDCDYCKTAFSNINNMTSVDHNGIGIDNNAITQPIPNVTLNQYTVNTASISSSNNSTLGNNNNEHINIPPIPTYNFNYNGKLSKCSSNTSLNTSASNHSIINSKTIGTPGYYCHRNRKNSVSKVIDMSMFVPPSEQELKNRGVHSSSLSIYSTPEPSSIQAFPSNEIAIGGSLGRNKNACQNRSYYGVGVSQTNITRGRSRSHSIANASKARMINMELKTSPIIRESSTGSASRIQFKVSNRCDSGTELANSNVNASSNINPSSPNKRPYPPSLASSSSSTTLSSSLSLTHISKPNLNSIPSSQSSSQLSLQKTNEIQHSQSLQNVKISSSNTSLSSIKYPLSSSSSVTPVTPIKPHPSFKITRSVTISEGTRRAEIDVQPMEPDEVQVYHKGRFTITYEHAKRPSIPKFQIN